MNPLIVSPAALRDPRNPEIHAAMLALAERLLFGREAHRAILADKGEPISIAVETSIRLTRALVNQWRWVVDPAGGELPDCAADGWWGAWPHEMAVDTALVADRARQRAASGDADAIATAEQCEVLAWYQHRDGSLLARIVNMIDLDRYRATRSAPSDRATA